MFVIQAPAPATSRKLDSTWILCCIHKTQAKDRPSASRALQQNTLAGTVETVPWLCGSVGIEASVQPLPPCTSLRYKNLVVSEERVGTDIEASVQQTIDGLAYANNSLR